MIFIVKKELNNLYRSSISGVQHNKNTIKKFGYKPNWHCNCCKLPTTYIHTKLVHKP